jgi:hypothetical protein
MADNAQTAAAAPGDPNKKSGEYLNLKVKSQVSNIFLPFLVYSSLNFTLSSKLM